tara:strand:- start:100 stop:345 length:246 start_codon:yes stop_codon:yes gene_type:complete
MGSPVYRKTIIEGREYKIVVGTNPEQCEDYYQALRDGDGYAAHIFHLPYVPRSPSSISSELKLLSSLAYMNREDTKEDLSE